MAKRAPIKQVNEILCKDCIYHYDPDWTNLGALTKLPILCKCRKSEFLVFYNIIEKKCHEGVLSKK